MATLWWANPNSSFGVGTDCLSLSGISCSSLRMGTRLNRSGFCDEQTQVETGGEDDSISLKTSSANGPVLDEIHVRIRSEQLRQRDRLERLQRVKQRQHQKNKQRLLSSTTSSSTSSNSNEQQAVLLDPQETRSTCTSTTKVRGEGSKNEGSIVTRITQELRHKICKLENELKSKTDECNRLWDELIEVRVRQKSLPRITTKESSSAIRTSPAVQRRQDNVRGDSSPKTNPIASTPFTSHYNHSLFPYMEFLHSVSSESRHHHHCQEHHQTTTTTTTHHHHHHNAERCTTTTTVTEQKQVASSSSSSSTTTSSSCLEKMVSSAPLDPSPQQQQQQPATTSATTLRSQPINFSQYYGPRWMTAYSLRYSAPPSSFALSSFCNLFNQGFRNTKHKNDITPEPHD